MSRKSWSYKIKDLGEKRGKYIRNGRTGNKLKKNEEIDNTRWTNISDTPKGTK